MLMDRIRQSSCADGMPWVAVHSTDREEMAKELFDMLEEYGDKTEFQHRKA